MTRMDRGRPSLTAAAVSLARGIADVDPLAGRALPWPASTVINLLRRAPLGAELADHASLGLVEHLRWRTRVIDEDLARTHFDQLVLLGAGLCTRAHRLSLPGIDVFEIDHPATQRYKREKMAKVRTRAKSVTYVPVDFARERAEDILLATSFDPARLTYVIFEGVTMYLAREAIEDSLTQLARLCAPASRLAMSYMTLVLARGGLRERVGRAAFAVLGEPLREVLDPTQAAALLRAHSFEVMRDVPSARAGAFASEHVVFGNRSQPA